MTWEYNNYLAHHGVKGQKWGARRYQNEDGTLTEEGKKRYKLHSEDPKTKAELDNLIDAAKGLREVHNKNQERLKDPNVRGFERWRLERATKATKKELDNYDDTIDTLLGAKTYKEKLVSQIKENKDLLKRKDFDDPELIEITKTELKNLEKELDTIKAIDRKKKTGRFD